MKRGQIRGYLFQRYTEIGSEVIRWAVVCLVDGTEIQARYPTTAKRYAREYGIRGKLIEMPELQSSTELTAAIAQLKAEGKIAEGEGQGTILTPEMHERVPPRRRRNIEEDW